MQQQTPAVFNFNGTDVRTALDADENVLFNVNDLCALLEYGNPRQALATHVQEDDVHQMDTIDNMGRNQVGNFVTEFGAYDLILGSRNKNAKEFKRWVTHDVLPSIRKTGGGAARSGRGRDEVCGWAGILYDIRVRGVTLQTPRY